MDLARELFERRQELGVEIVGFVDPDPARLGMPVLNPGVIGTIDDIPSLVTRFAVDRVVVSLSEARGRLKSASINPLARSCTAFRKRQPNADPT